MRLPPLGDRKPSVMLAEMLEYCPAGKSATAVLAYLFLQRLPREICVLLSEDDPADMLAIADKADRLIAMYVPQGHDACVTVWRPTSQSRIWWWQPAAPDARRSCPPPSVRNSSSEVLANAALIAARQARPPFPGHRCASTTLSSASGPSIARRGACGRKTRVPGRRVGGTSQPPLLHH
jgi:hypothetical protein